MIASILLICIVFGYLLAWPLAIITWKVEILLAWPIWWTLIWMGFLLLNFHFQWVKP